MVSQVVPMEGICPHLSVNRSKLEEIWIIFVKEGEDRFFFNLIFDELVCVMVCQLSLICLRALVICMAKDESAGKYFSSWLKFFLHLILSL